MEQEVQNGFSSLLRMGAMLGSTYGSYLTHAIAQPNWIRDKMTGWYRTHFAAVPQLPQSDRTAMAEAVTALETCIADCAAWLLSLLDELPLVLQWSQALDDAAQEASKHYEPVLDTAGQLAWMIDEAEQSGLADERIVHRYDMEDSEAEAAMKLIE